MNATLDSNISNLTAYKFGMLTREVAALDASKVGSSVDRGLILVRRLKELGYDIVPSDSYEKPVCNHNAFYALDGPKPRHCPQCGETMRDSGD